MLPPCHLIVDRYYRLRFPRIKFPFPFACLHRLLSLTSCFWLLLRRYLIKNHQNPTCTVVCRTIKTHLVEHFKCAFWYPWEHQVDISVATLSFQAIYSDCNYSVRRVSVTFKLLITPLHVCHSLHDLGVMIGRQGSVIKSMSEQSNCHMQLAEMNDPYDTKERIMIINGKNGLLPDLIHVRILYSCIPCNDSAWVAILWSGILLSAETETDRTV